MWILLFYYCNKIKFMLYKLISSKLDLKSCSCHRFADYWHWQNLFINLQVPNPFFDLAGITCGHFLVPFWTFFGATLIGKAILKMHIQVRNIFKLNIF